MASPLPVILATAAFVLTTGLPADVAAALGGALFDTAGLALFLCCISEVLRANGLAEKLCGASTSKTGPVRAALVVVTPAVLAVVTVCLTFTREAVDYLLPQRDIAYANSLGRMAFIAAVLIVLGTAIHVLYLTRHQANSTVECPPDLHLIRRCLTALSMSMLIAAVLAITGYYLSAFVLARVTFVTVVFASAIYAAATVCVRWAALRAPPQTLATDDTVDPLALNPTLQAPSEQAVRSIRFAAMVTLIVGSVMIWSDIMPAFRMLHRVEIWPMMTVLSDKQYAAVTAPSSTARDSLPKEKAQAEKAAAPNSPAAKLNPVQVSASEAPSTAPGIVTLADVLNALLIVIGTIVLARSLGAPVQLMLQRRLTSSGDRNAVSTMLTYFIVAAGVGLSLRQFGLRWSQIQWVAAAFSFGLAFGLQEVFANFVSGLIILIERPMAIGDFCRFGTNVGTIESIGLRSTRVRGVDRTVITVPNAEFSKREIVNFANRDRILMEATLRLRYDTSEDQLRYLLTKLWELLVAHPAILDREARVRFSGFATDSLNVDIFGYVDCQDYSEFLAIREDILLRIMAVVKEAGTGFALPSQTTYVAADTGMDYERQRAAESEVAQYRQLGTLPFPEFIEQRRRPIRNTIEYPPARCAAAVVGADKPAPK
jgi:small-conductance mechanosensitive channel